VKIEVQLAKTRALNEGEQESVKEQLGVFAAAPQAQDDKLPKDAMEFCGQFVAKWPIRCGSGGEGIAAEAFPHSRIRCGLTTAS